MLGRNKDMELMISINPPYTDMIFNGYKLFEFRKRILHGMDVKNQNKEIKAYVYETQNKGGCGLIIGEIDITSTYILNYHKNSQIDTELVNERFEFIKRLVLVDIRTGKLICQAA